MIDKEAFEEYARALGMASIFLEKELLALDKEFAHLSGKNLEAALSAKYVALTKKYSSVASKCVVEFYAQQRS